MLSQGQLDLDMFHTVMDKKKSGYQPSGKQQPEAPEQPPIQITREQFQQLVALPQDQLMAMAQQGQIPMEVAQFVLQQQQMQQVQSAPVQAPPPAPPAPAPQAQAVPQQPPAQPMPPGQMPGGLQNAPQPQLPPEFISPSGIPYSAAELIKAGMPPEQLLQIGYSMEDLLAAGVRPETLGAPSDNVHADVLKQVSALEGMSPAQASHVLNLLQQTNPELAQRVFPKLSRSMLKTALDPFKMLKSKGTVNNLLGMPTDMESVWVEKDMADQIVKKLLNDFNSKVTKNTESKKNNPGLKGPNENSPNKAHTS